MFHFNQKERFALIVLLCSIVVGLVTHWAYLKYYIPESVALELLSPAYDSAMSESSAVREEGVNEERRKETITTTNSERPSSSAHYRQKEKLLIDVNSASMEELQRIPGIGPAYSKRIIAFRDALGGFASIDQIGDTYYFPDSVFAVVKKYMTLDSPVKMIFISTANYETLSKHPYISKKEASHIIGCRQKVKRIDDFAEFQCLCGEGISRIQQLRPYLSYE